MSSTKKEKKTPTNIFKRRPVAFPFRMREDESEMLRVLAFEKNMSKSALIREALLDLFMKYSKITAKEKKLILSHEKQNSQSKPSRSIL